MAIKRTQKERLATVDALISGVYEEVLSEGFTEDILQIAVDVQIMVNRLVFLLNQRRDEVEDE